MLNGESLEKLISVDARLRDLCKEVDKIIPIRVTCGYRGEYEQNKAYVEHKSKVKYPNSAHNKTPSKAVDLVWQNFKQEDWNNIKKWCYFGGLVMGVAAKMGLDVTWGGDFNMNDDPSDDKWSDMPHFEIKGE